MPAKPERPAQRPPRPRPARRDSGGLLLGTHVSVAGGLERAFVNGAAVRASAVQICARNQRQWNVPPLDDAEATRFRAAWAGSEIRVVMSHAGYLLNLGSPVADKLERSRALFAEEVRRCAGLGLQLLTVHPGAHMGDEPARCIARVGASLRRVLRDPRLRRVPMFLETPGGEERWRREIRRLRAYAAAGRKAPARAQQAPQRV